MVLTKHRLGDVDGFLANIRISTLKSLRQEDIEVELRSKPNSPPFRQRFRSVFLKTRIAIGKTIIASPFAGMNGLYALAATNGESAC
jgi:hypothetical protein